MAIPIDAEGWLLPGQYGNIRVVRQPRTPKTSTYFDFLGGKPLGIVWHWAAGGYGTGNDRGVLNYMIAESQNTARKASWHFFITKSGEIHQFAPVSVATWTTGDAGKLYDPSVPSEVRDTGNVNRATVGVEMENAGVLLKAPNGELYAWPYGIGAEGLSEDQTRQKAAAGGISFKSAYRVDPSRGFMWTDGNIYDRWPPAQVEAAQEMARSVASWAGWRDPRHIHYGHRTFNPKRDPGLLWMDGSLPPIERSIFGSSVTGSAPGGSGGLPKEVLIGVGIAAVGAAVLLTRRRS
jgi:hypothetical protein